MNTNLGIYGNITNINKLGISQNDEIEVATRDEIQEGKAKILLDLENGVREEYEIEITKIYRNNNTNNKSMLIKVTDKRLLELTGGIVQRNERSTNYTKQQIYRSSNTCARPKTRHRLCSIWRLNDKTNKRSTVEKRGQTFFVSNI